MVAAHPLAALSWEVLRPPISSPFRFLIGDQATGWCSQGCQAIVDTGTSLLTVPQQFMSSLLQATGAKEDQYGQVRVAEVCPFPGGGQPGGIYGFSWEHRNSLILGLPASRCSQALEVGAAG